MLKSLTLLAILCVPLLAQPSMTTVAQTIYQPGNGRQLANGSAVITLSVQCQSGGVQVYPQPITVNLSSGNFSTQLVPNDTCMTPDGGFHSYYTVRFTLQGGARMTQQTWFVPTSGSPVTIQSVLINTLPTLGVFIQRYQISASGLTEGAYYCWQVVGGLMTAVPIASCPGGSSGSTSWSSLSSAGWSGLTSGGWSGLVM